MILQSFLIAIVSDTLSLWNSSNKSPSLKALRIFRVLRPLRLIAKSDNLKVVLDTLVKSFGTLMHVLMFIFIIVIVYAITGMELFGGMLSEAYSEPSHTCKIDRFVNFFSENASSLIFDRVLNMPLT